MYFEMLQSISLNGKIGVPNDDRMGSSAARAWVVDGATDLGEPGLLGNQGGAAWLSTAASQGFAQATGTDLRRSCTEMFDHVAARFEQDRTRAPVANWELPKAAFAAAQLVDGQIECAWAADCPILLHGQHGVTWGTGLPDTSTEVADAQALGIGTGVAPALSGAVLEDRRARRMGTDHAALSADPVVAARSTQYSQHPIAIGDEVLIMSDGFSSLVSDYGAYTAETLWQAVHDKGLAALAQEIREIEHADATCTRFPRFKVSDDATAIWLRVARR